MTKMCGCLGWVGFLHYSTRRRFPRVWGHYESSFIAGWDEWKSMVVTASSYCCVDQMSERWCRWSSETLRSEGTLISIFCSVFFCFVLFYFVLFCSVLFWFYLLSFVLFSFAFINFDFCIWYDVWYMIWHYDERCIT